MTKRQIIVDQKYAPIFLQWMMDRIGVPWRDTPDQCRTIAHVLFKDDGTFDILCVVALHNWTTHGCEGSIASDLTKRWFTRDFAFTVYDYVFNFAGKSRMNFTVRPDNAAALGMHEKLGHRFECRLEDAEGPGNDVLLYGLTKTQWQGGPWREPGTSITPKAVNRELQTEGGR